MEANLYTRRGMRSRPGLHCLLCALVLVVCSAAGWAQGSAGTGGGAEPRFLVDVPTAGMLRQGAFALDVDFFQNGGLLVGVGFGILDRLNLGISYGGSHLIGDEEASLNPHPGFNVRVRLFEEGASIPAIALGFDSQGKEEYHDSLDRYTIKSPGFLAVASKNFDFLGYLSLHGGANYSLEGDDRGISLFAGVEKTVGPAISILADYSYPPEENGNSEFSQGKGYLNMGLRWSIGGGLTLGLDLKDLAGNLDRMTIGNRVVRLEYVMKL